MKKEIVIIATIAMLLSSGLKAQTEKGNLIIGVSSTLKVSENSLLTCPEIMRLGHSTIKVKTDAEDYADEDYTKTFGLNVAPKMGYFIADNTVLGLNLTLDYASQTYTASDDKTVYVTKCIGPFFRYYITGKKVLPFIELGSSFGSFKNKNENQYNDYESTFGIITLNGSAGIAIPLGEKVTFDILTGYSSSTIKEKEDNEENWRIIIGTIDVKFGFNIYL